MGVAFFVVVAHNLILSLDKTHIVATYSLAVMSFVRAYLNSLPGLYETLAPDAKRELEGKVRDWLLSSFKSDLDQKVKRTFSTASFGPLPLIHEFVKFMPELFALFINGFFYSTIALAGVTAERFCCDLIGMADLRIDGRTLSDDEKQAMIEMRFYDLVELLSKWRLIQDSTRSKLHSIRKTRNKYIHPQQPRFEAAKTDAERLIGLLCDIAKTEFGPSATGRYTIVNGAITPRFQSKP